MRITALVPAFNEATRIAATVEALAGLADDSVDAWRIVVIDDGSADDTAAVATGAGAEVIELRANAGKGAALQTGLDRIADASDIILLLDADLAATAAQANLLLEPVLRDEADMTIAIFPRPAGKAGFGLVKRLARWGIARLGHTGFEATAPLSGQRCLSRAAWEATTPFPHGYGVEVALTVRALRAGLRVQEIPTTMAHAATGRDLAGFRHRGRQLVHVGRALFRLALEGVLLRRR